MQNFLKWQPDQAKNGLQQPSDGPVEADGAQHQGCGAADAGIAPVDAETGKDPAGQHRQQKNRIRSVGKPGPQGPQEAIHQPQSGTHRQAQRKPGGGNSRGGHPIRRRSQPPCRGSSYTSAATWPSTATWPPSRVSVFS